MTRTHMTWPGMFGAFLMGLAATSVAEQSMSNDRAGSFPPEEVLPVCSPDPADSWNRVFHGLFARTVRVRLSEEFAGAAALERVEVSELSRKALLEDHAGGLVPLEEHSPAYLPFAGNDYFFASAQTSLPAREAVLAPLRKRCESCHGEGARNVFTVSVTDGEKDAPPTIPSAS
jgi:hypothetical protein